MKKRWMGFALALFMVLSVAVPSMAWTEPEVEPIVFSGDGVELFDLLGTEEDLYLIIPAGADILLGSYYMDISYLSANQSIFVEEGARLSLLASLNVSGQLMVEGQVDGEQGGRLQVDEGGFFGVNGGAMDFYSMVNNGTVLLTPAQYAAIGEVTGEGEWQLLNDPDVTIAGILGPEEIWADETAAYTIWVDSAEVLTNANGFSVTVTTDALLGDPDDAVVEVLPEGFTVYNTIKDGAKRTYQIGKVGPGIEIGTDIMELLRLTYAPDGELEEDSEARFKLNEVKLWHMPDVYEPQNTVIPDIPVDTATTLIKAIPDETPVYSLYDINKDEVIDFADVAIALRGAGRETDDPARLSTDALGEGIFTAQCDVNASGSVDISDIAAILANYGEAPMGMVDPRTTNP